MKHRIAAYLQYLYFLRVSILVWLFLPLLCWLDGCKVTANITRGILTLDSRSQWFFAVFFIVTINMAVLITARNTVKNGKRRFRSRPPCGLHHVLTDQSKRLVWIVLAVVHIPTYIAIVYLLSMHRRESEEAYPLGLIGGLLAALVFWYIVSLFYQWTYRPDVPAGDEPGEMPCPASLVFPQYHWLFGDIGEAVPPPRIVAWLQRPATWFLQHITYSGYAHTPESPVWELHFLSTISLGGIFAVYLCLYPLTSPVLRSDVATYGEILFAILLTALFLRSIAHTSYVNARTQQPCRWGKPVKWAFMGLAVAIAATFIAALLFDRATGSVRLDLAFPTLASVLVLLGFLLWLLAGVAFFLDRYRLPVLTVVMALIFLPKLIGAPLSNWLLSNGSPLLAEIFDSDTYFAVRPLRCAAKGQDVPTPGQVLQRRVKNPEQPYIIVTASGGGIQAAEWTAQVMANLEKSFALDKDLQASQYTFHDHLLFASGVSGGSVGLMPFLLEYTADEVANHPGNNFRDDNPALYNRITRPPGCSSLEAVGWGLSYHDFYRLILPVRIPSPLDENDSPDRSWALAATFNRNLHDWHCMTDKEGLRRDTRHGPDVYDALPPIRDGEGFTLLRAAHLLMKGDIPAFTFNTTAAETGSRFLLSNYRVSAPCVSGSDMTPAESFLEVYAADKKDCGGKETELLRFADLPLATAARLSATFPIVSSGTRIPLAYTPHAYHFLDGGYYDNDGTASAIEFLRTALEARVPQTPRMILWIEIRDDDGSEVAKDEDDLYWQNARNETGKLRAPQWTPLGQLTGIVGGLWNAGHVSISRRNRREMCVFEEAYPTVGIHHIVFTIPPGKDTLSPLSWNLTSGQLASITDRAERDGTTKSFIRETVTWVKHALPRDAKPGNEQCDVVTESPEQHIQ